MALHPARRRRRHYRGDSGEERRDARLEHDTEDHERIEEAVLTLSTPDEPTPGFGADPRA